jgi:uncharacterized protein YkwD
LEAATTPARIWLVAAALVCAAALYAADASGRQGAPACANAGTPSSQLSKEQARNAMRCLINEERGGRRSLRLHRELNRAAAKHSRRMREDDCLLHACAGEPSSLAVRLRNYLRGASRTRYAEVIAVNVAAAPPRVIVNQWMTSAPHRKLVLGRFKHMGVGVATGDGLAWWTVELGWRKG